MIQTGGLLSAAEIARKIGRGELSILECAQEHIQKVKKLEPNIHAWQYFNPDLVLENAKAMQAEQAKEPEKWGKKKLTGVPLGVKDIFNTADMPTCMGSKLWEGFTPGNDARVVSYCRYEGALVFGKTVTAEFAVHNPGPTKNPHDPKRIPGTSSSGSAASVAAGMIPLSLGTQTAGSIIRPASYCGVYGFKPSFGMIPRTGVLKTTDTLDTIGLFARTLEDIELGFDVMHVDGPNFPFMHAILSDPKSTRPHDGKNWKIGLVKTHTWQNAQKNSRKILEDWGNLLSKTPGTVVEEVILPPEFQETHSIHADIYDKCLSYYFRKEFQSRDLISVTMNEMIARGQTISTEKYRAALEKQNSLTQALDKVLTGYDFLISLSVAGEAPLETEAELPDPSLMWTLCGVPSLNIPKFKGPNGMPVGVQIIGRKYYDRKLFAFLRANP